MERGAYTDFIAAYHAVEASLADPNPTPNPRPLEVMAVSMERQRIDARLKNFNPKDNRVWAFLTKQFGPSLKHDTLVQIATVLAQIAHLRLDRDATRRKSVLIKWFDENWLLVSPFLQYVRLEAAPL
jgi:hypothetical protein